MKYIRTKYGIHKHIEISENDLWFKKYVIAQADTIEELCDCFILIQENGIHTYMKANEPIHELVLGNRELYGAIWTDKGLIYVAKMNEKGELELL